MSRLEPRIAERSRPVRSLRGRPMLWHHARSLEHVRHGTVHQMRVSDLLTPERRCKLGRCGGGRNGRWDEWHDERELDAAHDWLAERVGFFPTFLAVGGDLAGMWITGYPSQFDRELWDATMQKMRPRKPGETTPRIWFSFDEPPYAARYLDYGAWFMIINAVTCPKRLVDGRCAFVVSKDVTQGEIDEILRPGWDDDRWLRAARSTRDISVMCVTPTLDLHRAARITCRSQAVARELASMGFDRERVVVFRPRIADDPW